MKDQLIDLKINEKAIKLFNKLGITRVIDLVLHFPYRYIDETRITLISEMAIGEECLIEGEIISSEVLYRPRKMLLVKVKDSSGLITCRFLHFYASQITQLSSGKSFRFFGEPKLGYNGIEMVHPKYHVANPLKELASTLTPVYPTVAGLTQHAIKKAIELAFKSNILEETVPSSMLQPLHLLGFSEAVKILHYPPPNSSIDSLLDKTHIAWKRIIFDELLAQQISARINYHQRETRQAPVLKGNKQQLQQFIQQLTFKLTSAQERVLAEIISDLHRPYPMHRLLQGDVGSGKTIIATIACLHTIYGGYQAALMAPTEILAEQHFIKIERWLKPLGIRTQWLTGSMKKKDKDGAHQNIKHHIVDLIIGTHALIQNEVEFAKLGLAVIDEQHRFGVEQRLALRVQASQHGQFEPHMLMMTATPIPRTLSMSYFADLDVSTINELPQGRQPIITKLIDSKRRDEVIQRIREVCLAGHQAYWVCPLIEESETLELETARDTFNYLQQYSPDLKVGLVHGKMDRLEKQAIMDAFYKNDIHILVATTVIEVGVDVPNATMIVIDHAERMGLAQLHQLRGRVGRGSQLSICILLYQTPLSDLAKQRLKIIYESNDGFELARQDLLIRGPGELLGAKQSGVPGFRYASLDQHEDLLSTVQNVADDMIQEFHLMALNHVTRWHGQLTDYLKA
ncbi:MAG: ATP-dependent DNA helicase RecG [Ferrovum sp. 37-45-19]|nr:MAG: ATP-dependent DNA helicase RecG [Ferrovum sp. 21-44-67]OYV94615.1 MAG: ATP-dependent DNA helicase RecG [Ferrovum sp. 37-45-19]HQT81512.1 ATP-dependent DNA helicase RecG [Ferrovaceae bacterium]HQU06400.1 ATP-dependent DNA helicase RecG [Ferrovaceae bacterium]